jgi:cytochrome c biogenesis protein CcmG, thiol:disulfide interchange protein DsbE
VFPRRGGLIMKRQWISVALIGLALALGTWWLVEKGKAIQPVEVGSRAPDFKAMNLKGGGTISFRDKYRGKVVLVNLWATWCLPCRKEMPAMEKLYRELGPKGFAIAAVSVDQGDTQTVLDFAKELGLTFDILHDDDGSVQQLFQTVMFPESFLVDKEGNVVKKAIGEHPWSSEANRRIVAQLLGITLPPGPDQKAEASGPGRAGGPARAD